MGSHMLSEITVSTKGGGDWKEGESRPPPSPYLHPPGTLQYTRILLGRFKNVGKHRGKKNSHGPPINKRLSQRVGTV